MKISYFQKNKSDAIKWDNITRDERYFCSELFHNLRSDQAGILTLIKEGINLEIRNEKGKLSIQDPKKLDFLDNIESKLFDIGFEVCFYRDILYLYDEKRKEYEAKNGKVELPYKRTFDLALFSDDAIIIIEAKAQQGFDTGQLLEFEKDRNRISKLLEIINKEEPKVFVFIVGLYSSEYRPNSTTLSYFDSVINWKGIARKYPASKNSFERADCIYTDEKCKKEHV